MNFFEKMANELSVDNMCKDMEFLIDQVGERLSGTKEMKKATEYICSRLQDCGIDSHIDHFPMYQSYPGQAKMKIVSPEKKEIAARPVCHIDSTNADGIEGELVYLGSGGYEDYEGIDVNDKIVLTDMNWSPGRPEKARIAWEMGAKALVIMNWGKAEDNLIQMGAVKAQWGNPTPETEKEIVRLTVISISRADGEMLVDLCEKNRVSVWLKADATREWITADQPIGRVYGGKSNGQYVLVGSHVDAWGKSAICNASGNALNLELARIFQKHSEELNRDIVFTFWDGHEIAEGGGSTWYGDNYWEDMTNNCVAYINIDNLAIKGTTIPGVESQPELKKCLMEAIQTIWNQNGVWHHAYKGGGDSSFFGIGVPYISFATEYNEETLKELNYAFYSPWLHSGSDTLDKIDLNLLKKHGEYFMFILEKLINEKIIPYNTEALGIEIEEQWRSILNVSGRAKSLIEGLEETFQEYKKAMVVLEEIKGNELTEKDISKINEILIYCERQTAIFRSATGRYGQDSCCSLQTENPIPALEKAIRKYNEADESSHDYYMWETQILRVKNMVYDALNNSIQFIKCGLFELK